MFNPRRQQDLLKLLTNHCIPLKPADVLVRLRPVGEGPPQERLSKRESFSPFNPKHMAEAKDFLDELERAETFAEFLQIAIRARDELNQGLFVFAITWAVQDFPSCRGLVVPPIHEILPDRFIPSDTILKAIELAKKNSNAVKVTVDKIRCPQDKEQRVAYFREDIGLNSHHWHWHLVYPFNGRSKDRRGELFYYMHQQLCARYECERLSVGLKFIEPLREFDDPLLDYSPRIIDLVSGRHRSNRPDGMRIDDRDLLEKFGIWRDRIVKAIHQGCLVNQEGDCIPLDVKRGIDLLGAVVEPSSDSVNREYYGNLHNMLHNAIAAIRHPRENNEALNGVIGENSTALRDPAFFTLHRFIDNLFNEYKITLPPYTAKELKFPDIRIKNVKIEGKERNVIFTYIRKATLQLNNAIELKVPVEVEYEHLDNRPYTYKIKVDNMTGRNKQVTVRIFMAPAHDDSEKFFSLNRQRRYFIEMDKFYYELVPGGNSIYRPSTASSVTLAYNPSFQTLKDMTEISEQQNQLVTETYCSCGWPQHLAVPKGTRTGMDFKLFVMLTDYKEDFVGSVENRSGAVSYCGVRDSKYPDKRAMGFPFDRTIEEREFETPNMYFTRIKVQFLGESVECC